ncbi:MAG: PHP domain-containing protein [candidate division WOR-3 bacterium]
MKPATGLVDLHTHTVFSDGLSTPEQVVADAAELGLAAVAITDHDSVGGIDRALAAGRLAGVEVVPGVEMSCTTNGVDVHILGYFVDHHDEGLLQFLARIQTSRTERAERMVRKLNELDIPIRMARVRELARGAAIGRPHVAQALVETGRVASVQEAFDRYIGYDGPAYFPKMQLTPKQGISFIHEHHGLAVIAHPANYHNDAAVYSCIAAGADGIEVEHPDHEQRHVDHYVEVAQKNGLLMTGGSDCHGGRKQGKVTLGQVTVPYKYLQAMKNRRT